jgi:glycosyltransferase involved in cell wall biosynthesis
MAPPFVSVIMPAYNAAPFIGTAIDSVLAQTYSHHELTVVDDGSTDGTAEIVRAYGGRLRYVRQGNARQAAARNRGIAESRGELIAFVDADDVWRQDKLERQVALLTSNPRLGLAYSSMELIDRDGRSLGCSPARLRGDCLAGLLLGQSGGICGSTGLVPRAVLERVGTFDVELTPCEETDLFWRIAAEYPIDYIGEPLVQYRIHPGNAHANVTRTTRAWRLMYHKALADRRVRRLGLLFRARCRGRLYHMLAGDHAAAGSWGRACFYALRGAAHWPPGVLTLPFRASRRVSVALGRRPSR